MDGPSILEYASPDTKPRSWGAFAISTVGWLTLIAVVVAGGYYGVTWRRAMWEETRTIRFTFDITNGYNLGRSVVAMTKVPAGQPVPWPAYFTAYLDSYSTAIDLAPDGDYQLDYAPGRLLIMSMWVKHLWQQNITDWNRDYATTAPLLHVNAVASALTAIAMGLLVRHWRRYRDASPMLPQWRSPWREFPATLAMLAVWLNPALIWNTHAWPQWDCWLLPFFVFGVLAASKDKWLLAGFLVALGAIFKGQVIMTGPVLILWALFMGKPLEALKFIIGVALLAALVSLVWIARVPMTRLYLAGCLMAIATGVAVLGVRRKFDLFGILAACFAGLLILFALIRMHSWPMVTCATLLIALIAVAPRWTPRKLMPALVTAAIAGCIFLAGVAWGDHFDWFEVAYHYPTNRRLAMSIGPITNLPAILSQGPFNWRLNDVVLDPIGTTGWPLAIRIGVVCIAAVVGIVLVALTIMEHRPQAKMTGLWAIRLSPLLLIAWIYPWGEPVLMRPFLVWVFSLTLILCAIGAAIQTNRRSPRVILALFTPWLLMFAIMPQMHERYLLWAAVLTAAGFGISTGFGLLSVVVMFLAWVNMGGSMLHHDRRYWPVALQMVRGMQPGAGWAVLLAAAVYLYIALAPERRKLATDRAQTNTDETQPEVASTDGSLLVPT